MRYIVNIVMLLSSELKLYLKSLVLSVTFLIGFHLNLVKSENIFQDVKLRFYYGIENAKNIEFKLNEASKLLIHPSFHRNRRTVIYIHGWNEKVNEAKTLLDIVTSYLSRNDHNILILNYEKLAAKFYPTLVPHAKELGKRVAVALKDLFAKGFQQQLLHLMGFSIGAHICGEIGRALLPTYVIPRITGFDPAYLMYYGTSKYVELNRNDAEFVDIIHTDKGISGGPTSSGHADFYPNGGGRPQPRCGDAIWQFLSLAIGDHCAHDASVHYFAESLTSKKIVFIATNRVNPNDMVQMGYNCSHTALGDYDLRTDV